MRAESKFVTVDAIRTHYLEAGAGPVVVLLHSGEFGGCAEISWEFNIDALSRGYRVIAPDWLGFGRTDKVHDFVNNRDRMLRHLSRFLKVIGAEDAPFVGNSMGGSLFVRNVASERPLFNPKSMVLASSGGFSPDNEYRRHLLNYDCTVQGMRNLVGALFYDPKWPNDESYVQRRYRLSLEPGAWECAAAARFKAPHLPPRSDFGQADETKYERIKCPTLIIAGGKDKLRLPNYADELARRIPNSKSVVFEETGHCPNIEQAERFNKTVLEFLGQAAGR